MNKLRYWRLRAKLTQEQLAHKAGLSNVQISRLERGKSFYSAPSLARLATALSVPPQEIVSEDEIEPSEPPEAIEAQVIVRKLPPRERPRLIAMMRAYAAQQQQQG